MADHECPTCGREFDARRGLGVHQVSVSFSGDDDPNYSGEKQTTICELCETEFEYCPSEKEGVYCPNCVESEGWRDLPVNEGDDHPRWSGGTVELEFVVCSDAIERYPSNATGDVAVCSEACRRTWLSESFSGSGHPNWKGGSDLNYGEGWSRIRRQALERAGYECVVCSKPKAEIGRNPDVHHVVPVRQFVESDHLERTDAHRLENVVSLCSSCHRRAEAGEISRGRLRGLITES